jgi:hypothetical protein
MSVLPLRHLRHHVRARKTRRLPARVASRGEILIRDLPLGVWKIPPRDWLLSLRRHDGMRDIRKVRGTIQEAWAARDAILRSGNHSMAWLMEDDKSRTS